MTTKHRQAIATVEAIKNLEVDEVMSMSDEELMAEAVADGEDVDQISTQFEAVALGEVMRFRQQKLANARAGLVAARSTSPAPQSYPTSDIIRRHLAAVLNSQTSVSLAFRNRQSQSDRDLRSIWDDFVHLGIVKYDDVQYR